MEQLLSSICAYFALLSYNTTSNACQAALTSVYIQSGGKNDYDLAYSYYTKKGENLIKDNIDNKIIYSVAGFYFLEDTYQKKEIKVKTPCNIFLCSSLGFDLSQTSQSYTLDWKWSF